MEERHYFGGGMIRKRRERQTNTFGESQISALKVSTFLYRAGPLGSTEVVLELFKEHGTTKVRQMERQSFDAWGMKQIH